MILHACIMGIRLPVESRPPKLNSPQETLTLFMELFDNIKRCRVAIANNERESDSDDDSSDMEDANESKRNITMDLNDSDDDLNEGLLSTTKHDLHINFQLTESIFRI